MSTVATLEYRQTIGPDEVSISPPACEQMAKMFAQIDDEEVEAIRIFVSGGGCSGMTYGMTFADRRTKYDRVLSMDGYDVYVDTVAIHYLQGVEIDYVARDTGASFVFNNVFTATGGSGMCGGCGGASG